MNHSPGVAIRSAALLFPVLLWAASGPAAALDYQLHGFAAQGYSFSGGNNYFGGSTQGSSDFYELGVNGTLSMTPNLLLSAQGLLRRAGSTDEEGLRLDYAQADYRFLSSPDHDLGLRLGRVKNPLGFYNDTRDVVFTRPGITLPSSIYLENAGLRSILFSRDGAQLYGGLQLGDHDLSLEANAALDSKLDEQEKRQVAGGIELPVDIDVKRFHVARLQDDWNGGVLKFALSYLHGRLEVTPQNNAPVEGYLTENIWVASARDFALTAEYELAQTRTATNLAPPQNLSGDSFYLQGEYHFLPQWTALLRYDAGFFDRHDRDGDAYAARTGGDRYSQFTHDEVLGVNWQPGEHWGVWAEYHLIQGSSEVPQGDNVGRVPADHSSLFQVMTAFRF